MKQLKNILLLLFIIILSSFICMNPILATSATNTSDTSITLSTTAISDSSNNDVNINDVKTTSQACLLMDSKTGKILYAKNAYEKMYPASTTKLMTAILTLENCKLTDVATVSHNAIYSIPIGYSHASLREGENLTIEQLLNVLLIPSANDAAVVLAEHISGSVENFSVLMNKKAKELGCKNTNFVNPNGIHDKNHYSTAYDLSLIGQYAMKYSDIMRIAMVTQYTLPITNKYKKTDRIFNATNALINNESLNKYYYSYATGLKTGYTDSAGSCIVSTAKKDDMELLAVILNGSSISKRYKDCINLFNYGFDNYSYTKIHSAKDVIKTVEIGNGTRESKNLDILVKNEIQVLTKNNVDLSALKPTIEIRSDLKAPIAENSVVGKISYNINGENISSDLIASSSVYASSFEVIVFRILLIFLILYIIYRLLKHDSNNSNRKNRSSGKITSRSKKEKSRKGNRKKREKRSLFKSNKTTDSEPVINNINKSRGGKGEFKFTQISDYL